MELEHDTQPVHHPSELEDRRHEPVLVEQVVGLLSPKAGQVCLDCTVGRGGHAGVIIDRLAPGGRYIGLDVDPGNIEYVREKLAEVPGATVAVDLVRANFSNAKSVLESLGVDRVDLLLADLGFASNQVADPARGLSFSADGPLDMRLDPGLSQTAGDLVNRLSEKELADLIYRYGQERRSRKIARKIVENRERSPIVTTVALAEAVYQGYGIRRDPRRKGRRGWFKIDPATRTFMALRIAVNCELDSLERLLQEIPGLLKPQGIGAIISFHSLEDRLVKHGFRGYCQEGRAKQLTAKPVVAGEVERRVNRKSRSAKLRAIQWLGVEALS